MIAFHSHPLYCILTHYYTLQKMLLNFWFWRDRKSDKILIKAESRNPRRDKILWHAQILNLWSSCQTFLQTDNFVWEISVPSGIINNKVINIGFCEAALVPMRTYTVCFHRPPCNGLPLLGENDSRPLQMT